KLSQRVKDAAATPNPDAKPDPSVKKAAKAHVDMTFFGLSLGQPLTLPACHDVTGADTSSGKNCGAVKTLSSTEGAVLDLAMATDSATRAGRFDPKRSLEDQFLVRDIQLTQANCPDWLHPEIECRVYGIFDDDGVLRGLLAPLSPEKGGELGRYLAGKFERHRKQLA